MDMFLFDMFHQIHDLFGWAEDKIWDPSKGFLLFLILNIPYVLAIV